MLCRLLNREPKQLSIESNCPLDPMNKMSMMMMMVVAFDLNLQVPNKFDSSSMVNLNLKFFFVSFTSQQSRNIPRRIRSDKTFLAEFIDI